MNRPMSSKPKITKEKKERSFSSSSSLQNITESENIEQSKASEGKQEFLDSVINSAQKQNFENLIKEEAERIDMINKQKENLHNINLLEKNIEGLYDWKTLFNNSRPLSAYTKLPKKKKSTSEIHETDSFKFPVALVDASESVVEMFIPGPKNRLNLQKNIRDNKHKSFVDNKSKISKKRPFTTRTKSAKSHTSSRASKKSSGGFKRELSNKSLGSYTAEPFTGNCTRPKSIYVPRMPGEKFYFSKDFSDYYNEDLASFAKKFPLLRAKILVDPSKLQKTLKDIRHQTELRENKLKEIKKKDDLQATKQEIIIAGRGGNAKPLLKAIYKEIHPDENDDFDPHVKYYRNTAKPLGTDDGTVDYSINTRTKHIEEFIKLREEAKAQDKAAMKLQAQNLTVDGFYPSQRGLVLETYDERDPDVQIFTKIQEEKGEEGEYEFENLMKSSAEEQKEDPIPKQNTEKISKPRPQSSLKIQIDAGSNEGISAAFEKNVQSGGTSELPMSIKSKTTRPRTGITSNLTSKHKFAISNITTSSNMFTGGRPLTSKLINQGTNTYRGGLNSTSSSGLETTLENTFIPVKSLPVRTQSAVQNQTYQKIQKRLLDKKEQNVAMNNVIITENLKKNVFNPNIVLDVSKEVNGRPQTSFQNKAIQNKLTEISSNKASKWTSTPTTAPHKINYLYFNDYIDQQFNFEEGKRHERELEYFYPINCFNRSMKYARNHYSSSNNFNVEKKRQEERDFIVNSNVYTKKDLRKRVASARPVM